MHKDPVCGMGVEKENLKETYRGKTYYFCNPACQWAFQKDPRQFVK